MVKWRKEIEDWREAVILSWVLSLCLLKDTVCPRMKMDTEYGMVTYNKCIVFMLMSFDISPNFKVVCKQNLIWNGRKINVNEIKFEVPEVLGELKTFFSLWFQGAVWVADLMLITFI